MSSAIPETIAEQLAKSRHELMGWELLLPWSQTAEQMKTKAIEPMQDAVDAFKALTPSQQVEFIKELAGS